MYVDVGQGNYKLYLLKQDKGKYEERMEENLHGGWKRKLLRNLPKQDKGKR